MRILCVPWDGGCRCLSLPETRSEYAVTEFGMAGSFPSDPSLSPIKSYHRYNEHFLYLEMTTIFN